MSRCGWCCSLLEENGCPATGLGHKQTLTIHGCPVWIREEVWLPHCLQERIHFLAGNHWDGTAPPASSCQTGAHGPRLPANRETRSITYVLQCQALKGGMLLNSLPLGGAVSLLWAAVWSSFNDLLWLKMWLLFLSVQQSLSIATSITDVLPKQKLEEVKLVVNKSPMCTHRQTSTSWSSSGQLHSYRSLQLAWLWFISSPSVWTESAAWESHTLWNCCTRAASPYTCLARWCSLKCVTGKRIYVSFCITWLRRVKCNIFGTNIVKMWHFTTLKHNNLKNKIKVDTDTCQ